MLNDAEGSIAAPAPTPTITKTRGGRRPAATGGDETRLKIVQAAIDTLDEEGIIATSARAIARRGEFNQALIFYHFGSVDGLLLEAAKAEGHKRAIRYAELLNTVNSTAGLIAAAREIHRHEYESGSVNVLAQLLAGANSSTELRSGLHLAMLPWMTLVQDALLRVLAGSSVTSLIDPSDATYAVASLFIGMELMALLDPNRDKPDALFTSVSRIAPLIDRLLSSTSPAN
jgi:AcrR family transcriptional regulator